MLILKTNSSHNFYSSLNLKQQEKLRITEASENGKTWSDIYANLVKLKWTSINTLPKM